MIAALVLAASMQRWVLVNDIHLDPFGSEPALYHATDTSPALWQSAVRAMHARLGDARVVFVGGDLLAHHWDALARHAGEDPTAAALDAERGIARDLGEAFPRAQFVFALGNNDDPCGDYRSETGGPYLQALERILAPLVQRDGAAPDFVARFRSGGFYDVRLPNGERAFALDSVVWSFVYGGACQSDATGVAQKEMRWLETGLSQLRRGTNAVVLMHVPPGYDGFSTAITGGLWDVPFLDPADNQALLAEFARHQDRIAFALAAHTHHFGVRRPGGVPMIVGSSISPVEHNAPAFYELDVDARGRLAGVVPFAYESRNATWSRASLESLMQRGLTFDCAARYLDASGYAACVGTPRRRGLAVVVAAAVVCLAAFLVRLRRRVNRGA